MLFLNSPKTLCEDKMLHAKADSLLQAMSIATYLLSNVTSAASLTAASKYQAPAVWNTSFICVDCESFY